MSFTPRRDRDAWGTIRGYVYQVELTIDRWLRLEDGQVLELERGEDIDLISAAIRNGVAEEQRLLEQIKCLEENITLNSPEAREAIANFVEHRLHNLGTNLRFCFVTTASIAREREPRMRRNALGIEQWENIAAGVSNSSNCLRPLDEIRRLLRKGTKPKKLPQTTWNTYQSYLKGSRLFDFFSLVASFRWSTGQAEPEDVRVGIEQSLQNKGFAQNEGQAKEKYNALFVHIFHLLAMKGQKRLTPSERDKILSCGVALSDSDRALLAHLDARLEQLASRVDDVESEVAGMGARIAGMGARINQNENDLREIVSRFAQTHGMRGAMVVAGLPPDLSLPLGSNKRTPRRNTVESIIGWVEQRAWIAIYGTSGSGKTELALLVAQSASAPSYWLSLRDLNATEAHDQIILALISITKLSPTTDRESWYDAVCARLGKGCMLVLDDLPQFDADSSLGREFLQLGAAFARHGMKLLTTTGISLSPRVVSRLGDALVYPMPCPPFTDLEVAEFLQAHGAPEDWQATGRATLLNGLTEGHPQLLAMAVRFLEQRNWRFSKDELTVLDARNYAESAEEEALRRIVQTVSDHEARQLLFRTTLFEGSFSRDDLRVIAEVAPEISMVGTKLSVLEGPWLQRERDGRFVVCPLVKRFGSELNKITVRAVHNAMGMLIWQRSKVSPVEIRHAIDHFLAAEQYDRAVIGLLLALNAFHERGLPEYSAGLLDLWATTVLPLKMDLGMRIYARVLQIVIRKTAKMSIKWLLRDLDALIDQVTDSHAYAFFVPIAHITTIASETFSQYTKYLRKAITVQDTAILPSGQTMQRNDARRLEHFVWHQSAYIANVDHLHEWMQTLRGLTREQLARTIEDQHGHEVYCITLTTRIRELEEGSPGLMGGWSNVDRLLLEMAALAEELELDLLEASVHRERVVVWGEHLKEADEALCIADRALAVASNPAAQLLLLERAGRFCLHVNRIPQGRAFLRRAASLQTNAYPLLRIYVYIELSRILDMTETTKALHYLEQAKELAKSTEWLPRFVHVQVLGELALYQWETAGVAATVTTLSAALDVLLACNDKQAEYKDTVHIFNHVLRYMGQLANGNSPVNAQSEPLARPQRGLFLTRNPAREADYHSDRVTAMLGAMAVFADNTANDDLVIHWAERGIKSIRKMNKPVSSADLEEFVALAKVCSGEYEDAISVAFASVSTTMAAAWGKLESRAADVPQNPSIDLILGARTSARWREVDALVIGRILLPAVIDVMHRQLEDTGRIHALAERLEGSCRRIASATPHSVLLDRFVAIMRASLGMDSQTDILDSSWLDTSLDGPLRAMARVGLSVRCRSNLKDIWFDQVSYLMFMSSHCSRFAFRRLITPYITRYWVIVSERQPFQFTPPALAKQEIRSAANQPMPERAKAVLRTVASSLGIRDIPPVVQQWLRV